jgi:hypothetical protein
MSANVPGQEPAIRIHETVAPYFDPAAIPILPLSVNLYTIPFDR